MQAQLLTSADYWIGSKWLLQTALLRSLRRTSFMAYVYVKVDAQVVQARAACHWLACQGVPCCVQVRRLCNTKKV